MFKEKNINDTVDGLQPGCSFIALTPTSPLIPTLTPVRSTVEKDVNLIWKRL